MGIGAAIAIGLGAAALSAGGQIGAAALQGGPGSPRVGDPGLRLDPGLQAAEFETLQQLGVFSPQVLLQGSPLSSLAALVTSTPNLSNSTKGDFLRSIELSFERFGEGERREEWLTNIGESRQGRRILESLLSASGFTNIIDLFEAETDYANRVSEIAGSSKAAAQGNQEARLFVMSEMSRLIQDFPSSSAADIEQLKGTEKQRILRDLNIGVDEQIEDQLRLSNIAGVNPGRALGDLEEFRARATQDADTDALAFAVQMLGGQQALATGQLNAFQGFLNPAQVQAQNIAQIRAGNTSSLVSNPPPVPNPFAGAIANIGTSLGGSLGNLSGNLFEAKQNELDRALAREISVGPAAP